MAKGIMEIFKLIYKALMYIMLNWRRLFDILL